MERRGLLRRTHGGALPLSAKRRTCPTVRNVTNIDAKRAIGALAAGLVPDGASLMLDSSSTAYEALRALKGHRELTHHHQLGAPPRRPRGNGHAIISVGGELRRRTMTFVGPIACQATAPVQRRPRAGQLQGAVAERRDHGPNVADAEVKRALSATRPGWCCSPTASKFDHTALVTIAGFGAIGTLVTDRVPSDAWRSGSGAGGRRSAAPDKPILPEHARKC